MVKEKKGKKGIEEKKIPEKKKKIVVELTNRIIKNNTIMIASIENISALQFQKIKRTLKNKAIVGVVKKSFIQRALEKVKDKKKGIKKLEDWLKGTFVILFSNLDSFELASLLAENKTPTKAKAGQTALRDIIIEAGITDLPAGPAITDLSKVKLKVGIEGGKIAIKESYIVTKKDQEISPDVAIALSKLEIMPFSIGLEPLASYDSKEQKIYAEIRIDKEATLKEIKELITETFNLALNFEYITKETVPLLIAKANQELNVLSDLIKSRNQQNENK